MSMLSKNLEKSLHRAFALAGERRHEYATLEHLLLAMTEDEDATPVLKACGVDIDRLRHDLEAFIDNRLKGIVTQTPSEPLPTAGFQRVVQRAAVHVQSSGRKEVTGANVLVALFSERDSHAVSFLENQGMSRLDAVDYIRHGKAKVPGRTRARRVSGSKDETAEGNAKQGSEALAAYCANDYGCSGSTVFISHCAKPVCNISRPKRSPYLLQQDLRPLQPSAAANFVSISRLIREFCRSAC